jgi:hypothetical protein
LEKSKAFFISRHANHKKGNFLKKKKNVTKVYISRTFGIYISDIFTGK